MKKKTRNTKPMERIASIIQPQRPDDIPSDVLGSYTGVTPDGSPPVQDADDKNC